MRTRASLLVCLPLLLPAAARGDTGTMAFTETSDTANGGRNDGVINIVECTGAVSDSLGVSWTVTGTQDATWSTFHVYASSTGCDATSGTAALGADQAVSSASGSLNGIDVHSKIISPLGLTCTGTSTVSISICVKVLDSGGTAVSGATASKTLILDPTLPGTPTNVSAGTGDGALRAGWTIATGDATATSFTATATPYDAQPRTGCNAGGTPGSCTVTGAGSTSCRISGLTNFACYDVSVVAYSDANNPSAASVSAPGVPMPVDDFWKLYQTQGGRQQGGCGGPAGLLALLALVPLAARLRRRSP